MEEKSKDPSVIASLEILARIVYDASRKEMQRKKRLLSEPEGFSFTEGNCIVCSSVLGQKGWYSKYGRTCIYCKQALDEGIIPTEIIQNRDSYYTLSGLEYTFEIKKREAIKLIEQDKLVGRIIRDENGKVYNCILLKNENPNLT